MNNHFSKTSQYKLANIASVLSIHCYKGADLMHIQFVHWVTRADFAKLLSIQSLSSVLCCMGIRGTAQVENITFVFARHHEVPVSPNFYEIPTRFL